MISLSPGACQFTKLLSMYPQCSFVVLSAAHVTNGYLWRKGAFSDYSILAVGCVKQQSPEVPHYLWFKMCTEQQAKQYSPSSDNTNSILLTDRRAAERERGRSWERKEDLFKSRHKFSTINNILGLMHLFLYLDVVSGSVKIVLRSAALDPIQRKNTTSIENLFFSMFYLLNASEQH